MPIRTEKGKARPQRPRPKDGPTEYTPPEPQPTQPRDGRGKFQSGPAGGRRALPAALKRALAGDAGTVTELIYRDTLAQFRVLLGELPANDSPAVQALVASQARAIILSAHYATAAATAGLATPEGMKLADMSSKLDARAERLAVTARDIAERTHRGRRDSAPGELPSWMQLPAATPSASKDSDDRSISNRTGADA